MLRSTSLPLQLLPPSLAVQWQSRKQEAKQQIKQAAESRAAGKGIGMELGKVWGLIYGTPAQKVCPHCIYILYKSHSVEIFRVLWPWIVPSIATGWQITPANMPSMQPTQHVLDQWFPTFYFYFF